LSLVVDPADGEDAITDKYKKLNEKMTSKFQELLEG